MSEETYLKCSCSNCAGHIEFPKEGLGLMIKCPHCGVATLLSTPTRHDPPAQPKPAPSIQTAPVAPPPPAPKSPANVASPKPGGNACPSCGAAMAMDAKICIQCGHGIKQRSKVNLPVAIAAIVVVSAAGVWFGWKQFGGRIVQVAKQSKSTEPAAAATPDAEPKPDEPKPAETRPPEPAPKEAANSAPVAKGPKALSDLKVSNAKLETTKGSSLIYVVGTVRNASEHQRFGVRVEFDLYDRAGNKIATPPSSDYKQIMEPREEWAFRAIVLDPKAVTAKLAKIKEDE